MRKVHRYSTVCRQPNRETWLQLVGLCCRLSVWLCLTSLAAACTRDSIPAEGRLVSSRSALTRQRLGRETRLCLPKAHMRLPVSIPPGAVLKIGFGVADAAWSHGLQAEDFRISFVAGGRSTSVWRQSLSAGRDEGWHDADVPLDAVAGRVGVLELDHSTVRGKPPNEDDVYWTNPRIGPVTRRGGPNIILLSIDTLRADHLGCYGYSRDTSPNIDRLAREGVLFRHAIAAASWTLPSHASMLTGLYPSHHRAVHFPVMNNLTGLRQGYSTLAELLWNAGYATAGFTGGGFVSAAFGFDRGFNRYWSQNHLGKLGYELDGNLDRTLAWIDAEGDRRFFVFLHTYAVHAPYVPPAAYNVFDPTYDGPFETAFKGSEEKSFKLGVHDLQARTIRHLEALYDAGIRRADDVLGKLFTALRQRAGDTCLIVTSDHGEEFNEHGNILHRQPKLYDEMLHVPLIVWCPSRYHGGVSIEQPVSIADVTPTLLDVAGVPVPSGLDGISLEPALEGRSQRFHEATLSEVSRSLINAPGTVRAARTAQDKLIVSPANGSMLFDLEDDPGETRNVITSHPDIAARLAKFLGAEVGPRAPEPGPAAHTDHRQDPDTIERLRALGYVR